MTLAEEKLVTCSNDSQLQRFPRWMFGHLSRRIQAQVHHQLVSQYGCSVGPIPLYLYVTAHKNTVHLNDRQQDVTSDS